MRLSLLAGAAALALGPVSAAAQGDLIFPVGEGAFSWQSFENFAAAHDFTGERVSITGPGTGNDKVRIDNVLADFEAATGADAEYTGSESFEQDIIVSVTAGSAPNVAWLPQPGLAADLAARGALTPLGDASRDWVLENYAAGPSWVDLGTYPGAGGSEDFYGFFFGTDVKSLVWYVPEQFDEAGYEVPETLEELKALTEQIVADGGTPWCIGLGSGAATGWPATDWVEDMMLRT